MHLDIPSSNTKTFNNILESFDYLQHVNFPTHIHGHWLDLFISRCNQSSNIIDRIFSSDGLSDHFMVIAELNFQINQHPTKETRGPGALTLVNSIAKYQLQVCQRMYIYALKCIIMKIKYV